MLQNLIQFVIQKKQKFGSIFLLTILLQLVAPVSVVKALTFKETLNFVGLNFSGPSMIDTLNLMQQVPNDSVFNLSGSFSELGFSSNITGTINGNSGTETLNLTVQGNLLGDFGDTEITLPILATGVLGAKNISGSAMLTFPFDSNLSDYGDATYEETVDINPKGKKIGKIKPKPRGFGWLGWGLLIGTTVVEYIFDSDDVTIELPNGTKITKKEGSTYRYEEIDPDTGKVKCIYRFTDPIVSSECLADPAAKTFTTSFKTTTVPEPSSTLGLLALGTLGAASTLKRKLKTSQSTEKEKTKVG
ncbi:PEP-CTERM sorting domain-containing protein [Microcystis aeruginosa CS-564/01]|uniref:PEP-CTERM sorting domain-containing protein n=1 Tax=Microcystis aeruginosa TaxID=1126 RepID=UPI0023310681|nr:PEP-CTERM sorting domain-containing protein [Microcystis aeruginosa]MDB9426823.1 PEP-CTERM sorting domain-containing protein [Microcystis aeruginosa CS-564/01]